MMRGDHIAADLLAELMTLRGTHAGAVNEKLQLLGRIHITETCKGLSLVEDIPSWSREGILPSSEEEAAETTCDKRTKSAIPHLSVLMEDRR